MNKITFLLGAVTDETLESVLDQINEQPAWAPFDARAMAFVGRFSQRLLTAPQIRQFPELVALGHWFREAGLRERAKRYPHDTLDALILGRGLAFHIAPANVDSVFMYSWLIALLAGNTNIVRVSQKASPQLMFLVEALRGVLAEDVGASVTGRIVLLTYPHDDTITRAISERCQVRMVWGGDATVATIRAIPLRATAVELCFPDRFSLAAIQSSSVLSASNEDVARLAQGFYNDTFWFAQQACSSPRMLAWVGTAESTATASARFWAAVQTNVSSKQPENTEAMGMARLAATFEFAAAQMAHPEASAGTMQFPQRLKMEQLITNKAKSLHCGNGMFLEQTLPSLLELAPQLTDKEQTLAVFGFDRAAIVNFVRELPPRALDRVVPIGQSLGFEMTWDGIDLINFYTRKINIPK